MRNALPIPDQTQADESWGHDERLDRDKEREPHDPVDPVQVHEDGHEKALMVGHHAPDADDEWATDTNDRDAQDAQQLHRLGIYGEG